MIVIKKSTDYQAIKSILLNPVLFDCTYNHTNEPITEELISSKEWLLVTEEDIVLGCFEIKDLTSIVLEGHIAILPKYWRRTIEIMNLAHQWCRDNKYKVVFTHVPENCIHMLKFMVRMGYEACGQIENGIIFQNKLVKLFLFNKQL